MLTTANGRVLMGILRCTQPCTRTLRYPWEWVTHTRGSVTHEFSHEFGHGYPQVVGTHDGPYIWRHLEMLKRFARAHDPAGAEATGPGELVVECPACPHPGKNLPEGWEDAPAESK